MNRSYAIVGLGIFGRAMALTLASVGCHVLAMDRDEERVREVADEVQVAMVLDATDELALRESGVKNVDVAVVSIGENIEASVLAVMFLKDAGVGEVVAKAVTALHEKVLLRLGVSRVVHPERDMAERVARSLIEPDILESIRLSADYSVVELDAPAMVWGKSIGAAGFRAAYGLNVLAIKPAVVPGSDRTPVLSINPTAGTVVNKGDTLVVLGSDADVERLRLAT